MQADTNLKFAGVKIKSSNDTPASLPNNITIANGFNLQGIINALDKAKNN